MPAAFAKHRPAYRPAPRPRPSAAARGYGTDWRALREQAKRELPYICSEPGCGVTQSLHLDHKRSRAMGGTDAMSNLQWLCHRHHSSKTARTDRGFGNPAKR
jgi:5-methylcytosine-specific restriction endonuclease McrA